MPPPADEPSTAKMLTMTAEVLESQTVYRSALASNIRAFHQAVKGEGEMNDLREDMRQMMAQMRELKEMMQRNMAGQEETEKKRAGNHD